MKTMDSKYSVFDFSMLFFCSCLKRLCPVSVLALFPVTCTLAYPDSMK